MVRIRQKASVLDLADVNQTCGRQAICQTVAKELGKGDRGPAETAARQDGAVRSEGRDATSLLEIHCPCYEGNAKCAKIGNQTKG